MERLLDIVAINALTATVLALVAAAATRWLRHPSLVHLLWVVVLLELVSPPLWRVGVLPRPAATEASGTVETARALAAGPVESIPSMSATIPVDGSLALPAVPVAAEFNVRHVALAVWIAGAGGLLGLALVRGRRFRRLLSGAVDGPAWLVRDVRRLGARMGLGRCPRVRMVSARISPMLWFRPRTSELLLPESLPERLGRDELRTVLAHELAHVRRRDHWTRIFELLVGCVFWWHPVTWWARRSMRRAEERCCDAWVVRTLPRHAVAYARALVKTVEFLSGANRPVPALASGIGNVAELKERVTMILDRSPVSSFSRPARFLAVASATVLLLVFPTWADHDDPAAVAAEKDGARAQYHETLLDLEREAMHLEQRLRRVRMQQHELETEWRTEREQQEVLLLEDEARELESAGEATEAELARIRARKLREMSELEQQRDLLQLELERRMLTHEEQLRELLLEAEHRSLNGDEDGAQEVRGRLHRMEREMRDVARASDRQLLEVEQALQHEMADQMRAEAEAMRAAGDEYEAARMLADARRLEIESDVQWHAQRQMKVELDQLVDMQHQLAREGLNDPELDRQIPELQHKLQRMLEVERFDGDPHAEPRDEPFGDPDTAR